MSVGKQKGKVMLRARFSNGVFCLGLDAENIKRLQAGQPILVSLAELGGTDDVMIMAGETVQSMVEQLEKESGQKAPEPTPLNVLRKTQ